MLKREKYKGLLIFLVIFLCSNLKAKLLPEDKKYVLNNFERILNKIDRTTFVDGEYYLNRDTISVKIAKFKGRNKHDYHLYIVVKTEQDYKAYTPEEIDGFKIGETEFFKYSNNNICCFINKIESGDIELYQRHNILSEPKFVYFLKLNEFDFMYKFYPYENNIELHESEDRLANSDNNVYQFSYTSKLIPEKFEFFISNLMKDCPMIVNKVKNGFYSIHDLPYIVETYNKSDCK